MTVLADNLPPRTHLTRDSGAGAELDLLVGPAEILAPALLVAVNASTLPLAIKNGRLRYLYANPAYAALLGMKPADLVGQSDDEVLSMESAAAAQHQDAAALLASSAVTETLALQVEGGDPVPVTLTRQALRSGTQAVGLLCWSAALSPGFDGWKVRESRWMMHLAKVAHELRTPLVGMLGMLRLTLDGRGLVQDHHRHLELVEQCGQHLLGMANDLVDFGRASNDILNLRPQEVNLARFVAGVEEWLAPPALGKQLAFHVHAITAPAGVLLPVVVLMDQLRVRQILFNLLSNALRHTHCGSISLETRLSLPNPGEPAACSRPARLQFEVRDTGEGMSAEQAENLFSFSRVLESWGKPRVGTGAGLGLPICRRLVRAMGGDLHVCSEPGVGSRFWFDIDVELMT